MNSSSELSLEEGSEWYLNAEDEPAELDPYQPFIDVEAMLAIEAAAEEALNPKRTTAAQTRNFYKVYNEQVRTTTSRTPFAPELGVGPTIHVSDEKQVACCGLRCALTWSGILDLLVSGILVLTFGIKNAQRSPSLNRNLRLDLTLISACLFFVLSILVFAAVTRKKKNRIFLWIFFAMSPALLLASFIWYYIHYFFLSDDWQILLATVLVAIYKMYQNYLVLLYIKAPQISYAPITPDLEFPVFAEGEIGLRPLTSFTDI